MFGIRTFARSNFPLTHRHHYQVILCPSTVQSLLYSISVVNFCRSDLPRLNQVQSKIADDHGMWGLLYCASRYYVEHRCVHIYMNRCIDLFVHAAWICHCWLLIYCSAGWISHDLPGISFLDATYTLFARQLQRTKD